MPGFGIIFVSSVSIVTLDGWLILELSSLPLVNVVVSFSDLGIALFCKKKRIRELEFHVMYAGMMN